MYMKNILVLQGHPDAGNDHFCDAIAAKYSSAAVDAGHVIRQVDIAKLDFPLLQSKADFDQNRPCPAIIDTQNDILWAEHIVVIYPLWLGDMPALVKGFWEQILRPGFAMHEGRPGRPFEKLLKGKSARVLVTMGMPSPVYRWFYKAHSVKSLKRNILSFCGFKPVEFSLIGGVREGNENHLKLELSHVSHMGRDAN
ncbi:MAG: putative NADPH-quinone reductase [Arenicella sp.]|jgi:putative NADPH-quinone reductase